MPRQENHSSHIIVGIRDLKRLCIAIDLKEETTKWDGIVISMTPKVHWTQKIIDNYWRNYQKRKQTLQANQI